MERYFTLSEVSDLLKVSKRTLLRWIESGKLKAFKLAGGRFWRVRERDLKKIVR